MNKRLIARTVLNGVLAGILIASPIACSVDQVIGLLQDAAVIASAAGPIIAAVTPEYGGIVSEVGKGLSDLSSLYDQFEKATSTQKPGIAAQIHALTSTALNNLSTLYSDAHIKAAKLQTEITAFVTAANTAIVALESKLASGGSANNQAAALQRLPSLPVLATAKTGADLKRYWNGQVGAAHPDAIVK